MKVHNNIAEVFNGSILLMATIRMIQNLFTHSTQPDYNCELVTSLCQDQYNKSLWCLISVTLANIVFRRI